MNPDGDELHTPSSQLVRVFSVVERILREHTEQDIFVQTLPSAPDQFKGVVNDWIEFAPSVYHLDDTSESQTHTQC